MIRKTLTCLSLLGLVVIVAAWWASNQGRGKWFTIDSASASVILSRGRASFILSHDDFNHYVQSMDGIPSRNGYVDVYDALLARKNPISKRSRIVKLDLWPLLLLLAAFLVWSVIPFGRSRRRRGRGLCARCGYDLRGSTEKCPECGTATIP